MELKTRLEAIFPEIRNEIKELIAQYGDHVISEVTVKQALGGMRGVKSLICETSVVRPDEGLIIRGIPILNLTDKLPEEIFYFLLTGELPCEAVLEDLQNALKERREVPDYVWQVLGAMSHDAHPMTMLSTAILVMQRDSEFARQYREGMHKNDLWIPTLEDSLRIIARVPSIAAWIYRKRFEKGERIPSNPDLDWSADFAQMLGLNDSKNTFADMIRLYMVLHSDHEGGNVSAHTCHCVASALSDPFYATSAGLNGLSGPLHGLANQECLRFILSLKEQFGGVPSKDELKQFAWDNLNSGKVIPGYGHAVLRVIDPRFTAFREFGLKICPDYELFQIVNLLFDTIPDILKEHGKAANPWPNVDAGSGALLYYYGITEFDYYTVLFGASRLLGMLSQTILSRGMGEPIERPKSVRLQWIRQLIDS